MSDSSIPSQDWCTEGLRYCYDPRLSDFGALLALLTGFAFAAIVLLVERRITTHPTATDDAEAGSLDATLAHLLAAFYSLLLASFLYATTTGDVSRNVRVLILNLVASLVAVIGVASLFTALSALVRGSSVDAAQRVVWHLSAWAVPLVLFLFLAVSVSDWRLVSLEGATGFMDEVWIPLGVGVLAGIGVANASRARESFRRAIEGRLPWMSIAASTVLAGLFGFLSVRDPRDNVSPYLVYGGLGVGLVILLAHMSLAFDKPEARSPAVPGEPKAVPGEPKAELRDTSGGPLP